MFRSYRIGTMFGFPIEVNVSFLFILGFLILALGPVQGLAFVSIIFSSVLLHELGHALMARHQNVHIAGIELNFFGGAAKMASQPRSAHDEVAIAAAGPAVSFALGGIGIVLASIAGSWFLSYAAWINIVLGTFNLIPALPMDGGRILRALLTRKHSFQRATAIAVTITRGFAIVLGILGIALFSWYLPLLAILLWFMGSAELRMAEQIGSMFSYDSNGYRYRGDELYEHVDVLPPDYWPTPTGYGRPPTARTGRPRRALFSVHRPIATGGFIIRQRNGRVYIEFVHKDG